MMVSTFNPELNIIISIETGLMFSFSDNAVAALNELIKGFSTLQDWNGDPCLPRPFTWDWLNCSSDPTPRVTAL